MGESRMKRFIRITLLLLTVITLSFFALTSCKAETPDTDEETEETEEKKEETADPFGSPFGDVPTVGESTFNPGM